MRPLLLTMQAFGTYVEKTEIDFRRLGTKGLFLVAGDTGSGKTTIFDGIMFALYGETSGGSGKNHTGRNGEMLRSDFAEPKQETYVELLFESGGHEYKIWRSPSYDREGYKTAKPADVRWAEDGQDTELRAADIDGKRTAGIRGRVWEVLGLTAEQFRQVAMIAQGDFKKLLLADTKTRGDIFKTIFNTGIYDFIQNRIGQDCREAESEFKELTVKINEGIKGIELPDCSILQEYQLENMAKELEKGYLALKPVIDMLEQLNRQENERADRLSGEIKEKDKAEAEMQSFQSAVLKSTQDVERCYRQYAGHSAALLQKNSEFAQAEAEYKKWDAVSVENLTLEEAELEKQMTILSKLETLEQEEKVLAKEREDAERCQRHALEKVKQQKEQNGKYEKLIGQGDDTKADIEKYQIQEATIQKQKQRLQRLKQQAGELSEEEHVCTNCMDEKNQRLEKRDGAFLRYQEADIIRNSQICGELAQKLETGKPCPVCGSTNHPNKACYEGTTITAEDVKRKQQEFDAAEKELREAEMQYEKYVAAWQEKKRNFADDVKEILIERNKEMPTEASISALDTILTAEIKDCETEKQAVQRQLKECRNAHNRYLETMQHWKEGKEILKKAEQEADQAAQRYKETDGMYLMKKTEVFHMKQNVQGDAVAVKRKLQDVKTELDSIRTEKQASLRQYQNLMKEIAGLQTSVEHDLQEQRHRYQEAEALLAEMQKKAGMDDRIYDGIYERISDRKLETFDDVFDKSKTDAEKQYAGFCSYIDDVSQMLSDKKKRIAAERFELEEKKNAYIKRITINQAAHRKLKQNVKRFEEVYKKYSRLEDLSKAVLGNYKLETYIQEVYFDKIIESANRRLRKIIHNQFELRRGMKTAGNRGLDLFIYDFRTGTVRDVKTLSGGEAFVASLSMALGLADIVSGYSAGVQIETLFIDEGFGSLDSDILEQALNVLAELSESDHLVGIISHVEELKRRIDRQIVVSKDENGGSHIKLEGC